MNTENTNEEVKPISVTVEEAKRKIADTINELKISPTILEWIIKDIYQEVQMLHKAEYENDIKLLQDKE